LSVAASTTATVASPTAASVASPATIPVASAAGPASAVAVIVMAAFSVRAVVATRGFVSAVLPAPARAEDDARDHQDNYNDRDSKKRTH
jgi:hypothetical protein